MINKLAANTTLAKQTSEGPKLETEQRIKIMIPKMVREGLIVNQKRRKVVSRVGSKGCLKTSKSIGNT